MLFHSLVKISEQGWRRKHSKAKATGTPNISCVSWWICFQHFSIMKPPHHIWENVTLLTPHHQYAFCMAGNLFARQEGLKCHRYIISNPFSLIETLVAIFCPNWKMEFLNPVVISICRSSFYLVEVGSSQRYILGPNLYETDKIWCLTGINLSKNYQTEGTDWSRQKDPKKQEPMGWTMWSERNCLAKLKRSKCFSLSSNDKVFHWFPGGDVGSIHRSTDWNTCPDGPSTDMAKVIF